VEAQDNTLKSLRLISMKAKRHLPVFKTFTNYQKSFAEDGYYVTT
jgi:hypothetical protein